jgi:hypothetical protein
MAPTDSDADQDPLIERVRYWESGTKTAKWVKDHRFILALCEGAIAVPFSFLLPSYAIVGWFIVLTVALVGAAYVWVVLFALAKGPLPKTRETDMRRIQFDIGVPVLLPSATFALWFTIGLIEQVMRRLQFFDSWLLQSDAVFTFCAAFIICAGALSENHLLQSMVFSPPPFCTPRWTFRFLHCCKASGRKDKGDCFISIFGTDTMTTVSFAEYLRFILSDH